MTRSKTLPYILVVPAGIFLVGIILYPILYGIYLSLTNQSLIGFPVDFVGLQNFINLFQDSVFHKVLYNSLWWSIMTVGGVMLLGFGQALLLNRPFFGRNFARGVLLVAWTVPTVAVGIIFYRFYDPLIGLLNQVVMAMGFERLGILSNTRTALFFVAIAVIWRFYPFVMLMLLAGLQAISPQLYEAASVDGATARHRFWHITLPMMRPMITLVTVLQFIWLFNHFDIIWILTQGGPADATHTMATYAFYQSYKCWSYGYASAIGVIMLIIMFVTAVFYLKLQEQQKGPS